MEASGSFSNRIDSAQTPARGRGLHHVALGAVDPDLLGRFYVELFELRQIAHHLEPSGRTRSIWLDMEGTILMVERSGRENLRVDGVGTGAFLLAFRVDEGNHAEQEKRLLGLGGRVESRTEFTSYCRDPEGNRLAFSHYPTPRNP